MHFWNYRLMFASYNNIIDAGRLKIILRLEWGFFLSPFVLFWCYSVGETDVGGWGRSISNGITYSSILFFDGIMLTNSYYFLRHHPPPLSTIIIVLFSTQDPTAHWPTSAPAATNSPTVTSVPTTNSAGPNSPTTPAAISNPWPTLLPMPTLW